MDGYWESEGIDAEGRRITNLLPPASKNSIFAVNAMGFLDAKLTSTGSTAFDKPIAFPSGKVTFRGI